MADFAFSLTDKLRVLVLGAYGLIGSGVVRELRAAGYKVGGLGRDRAAALRVLPDLNWTIRDMSLLTKPADWTPILEGYDAVVNCAGALQDGARDTLQAVHVESVAALARACATRKMRLVQISAAGASSRSPTLFLRSKAEGDSAVRSAGGDFVILRPGLVLAPTAYGGTALLRMLAAFPYVQPVAHPDAAVRTVSLADLTQAIRLAVDGALPKSRTIDLVEIDQHRLCDVIAGYRHWLGSPPALLTIPMPRPVTWLIGRICDGLGRLGWRSPLRSTALDVISEGINGDPASWREVTGRTLTPFSASLASMPALFEDRLAARMALLMPFTVAALFLLWAVSGAVGLWRAEAAARILVASGWSPGPAVYSVVFCSILDLGLAGLLLVRRYARAACVAMFAVSLVYLAVASITTPWMWADPLGTLVKIVPAAMLALVCHAMLQER
ncbi:SDR family oxidoreductase [Oricola sp.]|uniref:SDR family oxidoreductase n=1 Tax=Oricola sp. TaxID=1979950 RepID=UPI003BA9CAEA